MLNTPSAHASICEIPQEDWVGRPIGWHKSRANSIGLPEDDQHSPNALLQKQPSTGTQKKLRKKKLFKRVETHCSTPEAKEEELRYLTRQFSLNGYPISFVQKTLRKRPAGSAVARSSIWQVIPTSQKQSPVSSNHTESELPIVQQEPCAAD